MICGCGYLQSVILYSVTLLLCCWWPGVAGLNDIYKDVYERNRCRINNSLSVNVKIQGYNGEIYVYAKNMNRIGMDMLQQYIWYYID